MARCLSFNEVLEVFRVNPSSVLDWPFPHVVVDGLISEEMFNRLLAEFPDDGCFPADGKLPSRRDILAGQHGPTEFDSFLKTASAWREMFEYVGSPVFWSLIETLFGSYMKEYGYVPSASAEPDFGISVCTTGYEVVPHHGHRHHVLEGTLYLGDEEVEYGGELFLHAPAEPAMENYPWLPDPSRLVTASQVRPARNRGVLWLNTPNSYHSVSHLTGRRRFCYFAANVAGLSAWQINSRHRILYGDPNSPYRAVRQRLVCDRVSESAT